MSSQICPGKSELRIVIDLVAVPVMKASLILTPSMMMLEAGLKSMSMLTDAPDCGVRVTGDDFIPPWKVP